jgi:DNA-binding NarL/FixJ family response regulator
MKRGRPAPEPTTPAVALRAAAMDEVGPSIVVLSFPLADTEHPFDALTKAERVVARLALQGLSNREIAEVRGTSIRTVANQVASLLARLEVTSRRELAARYAHVSPRPPTARDSSDGA